MERKEYDTMIQNIVVAATNANGDADLFFFKMRMTEDDYNNGYHYESAIQYAESQDYEQPMVVFDGSMPKALEDLFEWDTASIIDL